MSTKNHSADSSRSADYHPHAPRIVFMGTPEFAVASLDALVQAGCNIVAIVTAPDKPAGRGMKMNESAVKKFAVLHNLPVLQPEKLKDPAFLSELRSVNADLQVVVAFRMLPEMVWNMPPMGTINLHGSLLPQYRGAAPINWAVINGERQTGVTTFKLQHDIDTGNILLQEAFPIGEDETAGEVHDRMKGIGARVLVQTVDGLVAGTLKEVPQAELPLPETDSSGAGPLHGQQAAAGIPGLKHAPKIFTETCKIDWNKPAGEVYNLIRGLSPFPAAFTYLDGKLLKIFRAGKEIKNPASTSVSEPVTQAFPAPGQYSTDKKTWLKFACADGIISLEEIQLEGKKKMRTEDFLRGYKWA